MLTGVELMEWIEHFGRWNVQELLAKRQDMRDVITYLRAERNLEMFKAMPFVTGDLVSFEKRGPELCAGDGLILNLVRINGLGEIEARVYSYEIST